MTFNALVGNPDCNAFFNADSINTGMVNLSE